MPQALRDLCLIHFWSWENSPFPLLALWGNKNGIPGMNVKKLEKFEDKNGSMGYKWPGLNAPGIKIHLSHSFLGLGEFPFPIIGPLGQ